MGTLKDIANEIRESAKDAGELWRDVEDAFVLASRLEEAEKQMREKVRAVAKQLHDALMCILSEKNNEYECLGFSDDDGDPQLYEDGGNYSTGGIMSGYGERDFDFREAAETLKGTGFELPKYGSARKFMFDLSAFATKEGAEAACKKLSEAIRQAEGGAE